ncbi:hypothetical protein [Paracoccus sp. R86501]|uniref:hypothetical protein n=1 Tax=Paracoccus sp. R86501 TaxID=3101711 RepID=UPI00366B3EA2
MTEEFEKFVRITVTFKNGVWMTSTGRKLTAVEGTTAEFLLPAEASSKLWPQREVPARKLYQFLAPGAHLMFALRVRQHDSLAEPLLQHLIPPQDMRGKVEWGSVKGWHSTEAHFIQITLDASSEEQRKKTPDFTGGVLVEVRGNAIKVMDVSPFTLPKGISGKKLISLNHAFTILSEVYEIHRAAHTGSIYETVFYQGSDNRWYPLGHLRKLDGTDIGKTVLAQEETADLFSELDEH